MPVDEPAVALLDRLGRVPLGRAAERVAHRRAGERRPSALSVEHAAAEVGRWPGVPQSSPRMRSLARNRVPAVGQLLLQVLDG